MLIKSKSSFLVALMCSGLSSGVLAQAHNHGHGEVFIVQQETQWQLQFTLPAADVFGFEHEPENHAQHEHVEAQVAKLEQVANLITLPKGCVVDTYKLDVPFADHHEDDHHSEEHDDEHDHAEHDEGHDAHDDDDHHDEDTHSDVASTIVLNCKRAITEVEFSLFATLDSLEELDVMWAIDKGQGSQEVTGSGPVATF